MAERDPAALVEQLLARRGIKAVGIFYDGSVDIEYVEVSAPRALITRVDLPAGWRAMNARHLDSSFVEYVATLMGCEPIEPAPIERASYSHWGMVA